MAFTGYVYSEMKPGARNDAWTMVETSINVTPELTRKNISPMIYREESSAINDTDIYLHEEAASEPVTDDVINEIDFSTDTEDTYSAVAPGYIMSWTSEAGFFTSNQNFADHQTTWTIRFNCKYSGTLSQGYSAFIRFKFYKRDTDDNDTLLFQTMRLGVISTLKSFSGYNTPIVPTGSVTTSDRLRIRIYIGEQIPV